ncbi:MAG TPA: SRPBCC family protein [Rhizomicrobium sp.]|nr:SRPBCC family protein [Rhizomicrobium sp.]
MSEFVYVTYIRTTPQKLWEALTTPEFNRQFWFGAHQEADWKTGGAWKIVMRDGKVADAGEVLECDPPKRLVLKWRNEFMPDLTEEGFSRCVFDIEQNDDSVKLTVAHSIDRAHSKLITAVSGGWPKILASLKSLLETGKPLGEIHQRT